MPSKLIRFLLPTLVLAGCPAAPKKIDPPPPVEVPVAGTASPEPGDSLGAAPAGAPTVEEAVAFSADLDAGLRRVGEAQARAEWINETNLTEDTNAAAA